MFYTMGVFALILFFSPFVAIYFMVKGFNKLVGSIHSKINRVDVVNDVDHGTGDMRGLLNT